MRETCCILPLSPSPPSLILHPCDGAARVNRCVAPFVTTRPVDGRTIVNASHAATLAREFGALPPPSPFFLLPRHFFPRNAPLERTASTDLLIDTHTTLTRDIRCTRNRRYLSQMFHERKTNSRAGRGRRGRERDLNYFFACMKK